MKLLLFDIDGTLLFARGGPQRAYNRAFFELFAVAEAWGRRAVHGMTDTIITQAIAQEHIGRRLNDAEHDSFCDLYVRYLEEELAGEQSLCLLPGVVELLERLSALSDVLLGIQTGNYEQAARLKLRRAGIDHCFRFGGFARDGEEREELVRTAVKRGRRLVPDQQLSSKDIYLIGDTHRDVIAGKGAGIGTVVVLTNPYYDHNQRKQEILESGPDAVLPDLSDAAAFFSAVGLVF